MPILSRPRPLPLQIPRKISAIGLLLMAVLAMAGCEHYGRGPFQTSPFRSGSAYDRTDANSTYGDNGTYGGSGTSRNQLRAMPKGGGRRVLGRPYWMFGRRYVPRREPDYDRTGDATWVSTALHGNRTANGELEDTNALVAAHPTLPLPSYAEVTNLANGCRIFLRLNDRGPFIPGRIIDMSPRASKLLRFYRKGVTRVRLRYWGPAPLSGDDSFERQYLRRYPDLGCRSGRMRVTDAGSRRTAYRGAPYRRAPYRTGVARHATPHRSAYSGPLGVAYSSSR